MSYPTANLTPSQTRLVIRALRTFAADRREVARVSLGGRASEPLRREAHTEAEAADQLANDLLRSLPR